MKHPPKRVTSAIPLYYAGVDVGRAEMGVVLEFDNGDTQEVLFDVNHISQAPKVKP